MANKATGRIRITKMPAGDAPESVRKAWVGLVLPCMPVAGSVLVHGALQAPATDLREREGYIVPQAAALRVLRQHSSVAYTWWVRHGYPKYGKSFVFGFDEADMVSGVRWQTLVVADDMETGRMEIPGRR